MAGMQIEIRFPEIEKQLTRIADALEDWGGDIGGGGEIDTPSMTFIVTDQETVTTSRKGTRKAKESTMLKMVGYFQLSTTDPSDGVTERHLTVTDDAALVLHDETLPGDAVKSGEVKIAVGTVCHAVLVDQDQGGLKSDPFTADFTVSDKMPPPKPGMTGFVPTGQVDEP